LRRFKESLATVYRVQLGGRIPKMKANRGMTDIHYHTDLEVSFADRSPSETFYFSFRQPRLR